MNIGKGYNVIEIKCLTFTVLNLNISCFENCIFRSAWIPADQDPFCF